MRALVTCSSGKTRVLNCSCSAKHFYIMALLPSRVIQPYHQTRASYWMFHQTQTFYIIQYLCLATMVKARVRQLKHMVRQKITFRFNKKKESQMYYIHHSALLLLLFALLTTPCIWTLELDLLMSCRIVQYGYNSWDYWAGGIYLLKRKSKLSLKLTVFVINSYKPAILNTWQQSTRGNDRLITEWTEGRLCFWSQYPDSVTN